MYEVLKQQNRLELLQEIESQKETALPLIADMAQGKPKEADHE